MEMNPDYRMSQAIREAYGRNEDDETMLPLVRVALSGTPIGRMKTGDGVIFYNIRGEREVELTRALADPNFREFPVRKDLNLDFATMVEYAPRLKVPCAFPPEGEIRDTLCEVISQAGRRQIKITEAEKAIHVGYFLNGKRTAPFPGEERIIVPTRKDVTLFDEAPRMSIDGIVEAAVEALKNPKYDFLVVNFPNVDVVGHIENEKAVMEAVSAVDEAMGKVLEVAKKERVTAVVTADHGTVEKWLYPDGKIDTGHTTSPVPFAIIHPSGLKLDLREGGSLIDVAPTILHLLGLDVPSAMRGRTLVVGDAYQTSKRVILLILDGWGESSSRVGNLISRASTPIMDRLRGEYPFTLLRAAEGAVGLPEGTVGNSEAGHLHIGAGRVIPADRVRIEQAIGDGSFFQNSVFRDVMQRARERKKALHLMGIVSFFSSHGSVLHLYALLEMAKLAGVREVYIHAMLGRRGEKPESGARYVREIEEKCGHLGVGQVVSVIGRYWSLDREENWDRIEKTYRMLVFGEGRPVF
ncbi:MAG: alkaline phosphatase [Syntrophales bacterium]|nr:alkaline phosphatase [Syntrophales bacterium]